MIPSVTAQGLSARLLAHPVPGMRAYNSGLIEKDGRRFLATRRFNEATWGCDIVLGELIGAVVRHICVIRLPRPHGREWHEDGRLFWYNGKVHLAYTEGRYWGNYPCIHRLAILGDDWAVERVVTIAYGQNTLKPEKNWQFFKWEGELHFIYSISPHVVVRLDADYKVKEVYRTSGMPFKVARTPYGCERKSPWEYLSELRGGTPPVVIENGDGSLSFITFPHFHKRHEIRSRRYGFTALRFEARPPFKVTGITAPLAMASEEDPTLPNLAYPHWTPIVVFPCGALFDEFERSWTVIAGVNDSYDALFHIPHASLHFT